MNLRTTIAIGAVVAATGLELLVAGCAPQVTPTSTATPKPTQNPFEAAAEDYITNPGDPAAKKNIEGMISDILNKELEKDTVVKSFGGENYSVDTKAPYGIPRGDGLVAEQEGRLILRNGSSLISRMETPVPYTPLVDQNLKVMPPIFGVTLSLDLSNDTTQVLGYTITATPEGSAKGAGSSDMYERVEFALKADAPLLKTDFSPFISLISNSIYGTAITFDDTLPRLPGSHLYYYAGFQWPNSELGTSNEPNNKLANPFGPGFRNSNVEGVKIVQSIKEDWYEVWLGESFARQPTGLSGADYGDFITQKILEYSADKLVSIKPVFDEETGLASKFVVTSNPPQVGEFGQASIRAADALEARISEAMRNISPLSNYQLKLLPNPVSDPRPDDRILYFKATARTDDGNFSKTLLTRAVDEAVSSWARDSTTTLRLPYDILVSPNSRSSRLSEGNWTYQLTFTVSAVPRFQPTLDNIAMLGAFK